MARQMTRQQHGDKLKEQLQKEIEHYRQVVGELMGRLEGLDESPRNGFWRTKFGVSLAVVIITGLLGWMSWLSVKVVSVSEHAAARQVVATQIQHDQTNILTRLEGIERGRFTAADGLDLMQALRTHEELDGHPVITERVSGISSQLTRIEKKLDQIESLLN